MKNRDIVAVAIAVLGVAALTLLRLEMSREARSVPVAAAAARKPAFEPVPSPVPAANDEAATSAVRMEL